MGTFFQLFVFNINMIPTLNDIITSSKFHPSRVFCVYIFGSRVYGTNSDKSDWDIIMVSNNSVDVIELSDIKGGLYNIHVYTPKKFQEDLDWHRINNLECIFSPDWAKIKEDREWKLNFDYRKLRHATSHISNMSWVKSKKKLLQGDYYQGIKSLYHSIRIPLFATQIGMDGKITDFSCANFVWDKLKSRDWTWEELDVEFGPLHNRVLSDFRKVVKKI